MTFDFIGDSYSSQSPNADYQKTLNMYKEPGSSNAKSPFQLYPTPGLSLFSQLPTGPVRAIINANQRCFAVGGSVLYEVLADGSNSAIGNIASDADPASLCNSATQLLCISGGVAYVYTLSSNTWAGAVATGLGQVKMGAYADGFFIALISNSQKFQISSPLDATMWDPADVTQVTVFPDSILSLIVDHREVFLSGVTKSVWYGNTGGADFPYSPILSSYMEQGIAAAWARDRLDNSVFWLGADDRGRLVAWRAQGYTPVRVSNHAVENTWQNYVTTDDAISYSYQDRGHTFWQIYFPTQSATWTYDVATGTWHERSFLNNGVNEAHLSRCHTFIFGQHLVGDRRNGNIYVMNINIPDDDGQPIKRQRRSPHIAKEQQWIYHSQIQIDAETGLPTSPSILDGVTYAKLTASPGNPIGSLGPIYVLAQAQLNNGSRLLTPILGPYDNGDQVYVQLTIPVTANVISWRFLYAPTLNGPSYYINLTNLTFIGVGAGGIALGAATPNIPSSAWTANVGASLNWFAGLDVNGKQRNPTIWLNWADDGGHAFKDQVAINLGEPGQYTYRSILRRLGRSRDRIYNIEYSDTAPLRIVNAYLQTS